MASDWNTFHELIGQSRLTATEGRVASAIARCLLGWEKREGPIGRALLLEYAPMHKRSFDRAISGLIAKGIIRVDPGSRGRGHRSIYTLLLDPQKAAPQRPKPPREKAAPQRPNQAAVKGRSSGIEKAAPQRPRRGLSKGRDTDTIQTRVFNAYLESGGSLELDQWRGALAQHATSLAKKGTSEEVILAAARDLGRSRDFPGFLTQTAERLATNGGPCRWDGCDREALSAAQLGECRCHRCQQWLASKVGADRTREKDSAHSDAGGDAAPQLPTAAIDCEAPETAAGDRSNGAKQLSREQFEEIAAALDRIAAGRHDQNGTR